MELNALYYRAFRNKFFIMWIKGGGGGEIF